MVEMIVSRLGMDPTSQSYVVVLQEKDGARLLPIWIGQPEAESIVMQMHQMKRARPLTHDLCKTIITALGATLRRIQITRVENNTYFGELQLVRDGQFVQIDSRPSDAIAIALRLAAPIFAAEALLSREDDDEDTPDVFASPDVSVSGEGTELTAEQLKQYLEHLRPEDFGKFNP